MKVSELWRFPVKSMQGDRLDEAIVTPRGLLGDRAYGLIDTETGNVVSAKSVKRFPGLLACRASFVEEPRLGEPLPVVRIDLPGGAAVLSDAGDVDSILTDFFGREVSLAQSAPADFTIDQYHPDIENVDPFGNRDNVVQQKLGAALFAEMGADSAVRPGSFMDVFPVSLLTTSTVARLQEIRPESTFDTRRFRMNVTIDTRRSAPQDGAEFLENDWVGSSLAIGEGVEVHVTMPGPRCVMTTLPQEDLPADNDVLRVLAQHNRLDIMGAGKFPCAGVYAVVIAAGVVGVGDRVQTC